MIRRAGIIFTFIIFTYTSSAQDAVSTAMGGTSVAYYNGWSAAGNPAGMVFAGGFHAGVSCDNRFLVRELSREMICLSIPVGNGVLGGVVIHDGFSAFSRTDAGVAWSMKLASRFSAGIRIDYSHFSISEGYGSSDLVTFSLGALYRISNDVSAGLLIINPYVFLFNDEDEGLAAPMLKTGIAWDIGKKLIILIDGEKDLTHPVRIRTGMQYHLVKPLYCRIGFSSSPSVFTFGFGLAMNRLRIDLSSSYHPVLGYSPCLSLLYSGKR
jgi:hypothetical protein